MVDPVKNHLQYLSDNLPLCFQEDHAKYLWDLKKSGFEPRVIYDIGSCVVSWTKYVKQIWPDAQYILFDAFKPAEFLYQGYDYHMGVLSDEDDMIVRFYQNDMYPGGNSYYREVAFDNGKFFPENVYHEYMTSRLDTVVRKTGFPLPDLVKIDVQGAERDIIMGGIETICAAKHLVVEMQRIEYNKGAPLVWETLPFIESLGWKCVAPLFCDNGPDGDYGFVKI